MYTIIFSAYFLLIIIHIIHLKAMEQERKKILGVSGGHEFHMMNK